MAFSLSQRLSDSNGRIILATLLAEGWQPLQRGDYHARTSINVKVV
jgi:hypothetical protein